MLRFCEWAGKSVTMRLGVPPGATSATLTNLTKAREYTAGLVQCTAAFIPTHPFEIQTVEVSYVNDLRLQPSSVIFPQLDDRPDICLARLAVVGNRRLYLPLRIVISVKSFVYCKIESR